MSVGISCGHMRPWTQLLEAWEKDPVPDTAIELCEALGSATDPTVLPTIGRRLATHHASDAEVLVALGRALLSARRLGEAQSVLVSAGKAEPKNPEPYRWLGEVLLFRGDAERAAKVLDRAVSLGKNDEETSLRRDRAREYIEIQQRYGPKAVAEDVEQQSARPTSKPDDDLGEPEPQPDDDSGEPEWIEPEDQSFDDVTTVAKPAFIPEEPLTDPSSKPTFDPTRPIAESGDWFNPHPPALPSSPPKPGRVGTLPPPPMVNRGPIPELPAPAATGVAPIAAVPPRTPVPSLPPRTPAPPPVRPAPLPPPRIAAPLPSPVPPAFSRPAPVPPPPARSAPPSPPPPAAYTISDPVAEPPTVRNAKDAFWKVAPAAPRHDEPPPGRENEPPPSRQISGGPASRLPTAPKRPPNTADVLEALATTGVFETSDRATYGWADPRPDRTRFVRALAALTIVLLGAGAGGFYYLRDVRRQQTTSVRMLDAEAEISLSRATRMQDFQHVESKLAHAFDALPSRGTALLWVKERFLRSLLTDGDTSGIDTAITRARQAGVPDADLAFARIGSFLFQGDTAGAAMLATKWDQAASSQALFHLAVGAVLDRAGDSRAAERYELAMRADANLLAAQVMLARAVILDGDSARGLDLARAILAKWPDRVEGAALVALAWLNLGPLAAPPPPENARVLAEKNDLCLALRGVPGILAAIDRTAKPNDPDLEHALSGALATADTAGFATMVGHVALRLGYDSEARRAAAKALSLVPTFGPARLLAGKAAFASGALFEAQAAIDDLHPSSSHVALVKAAAAYERMDIQSLADTIQAMPAEVRAHADLTALVRAPDLARSPASGDPATLLKLASRQIPWGEIIATDVAMDSGNLALAKQLLDAAADAKTNPSWAIRRARLLRLSQRSAEADEPSKLALSSLLCQRTVIERVLVLVALSKTDDARRVVANNAAVLGPLLPWLDAYVEADGPRAAEVRAKVASLAPPPATAALQARVIAVMALARLREKARGTLLIRALAKAAGHNPDFIAAAIALR
jgi:hypothetical protein